MENANHVDNRCHDCGCKVIVSEGNLIGGKLLEYKSGNEKIKVIKCDSCFEKNSSLSNYQPCEVYSRVVGYIRPIQQWNAGKKLEYEEREEYKEN